MCEDIDNQRLIFLSRSRFIFLHFLWEHVRTLEPEAPFFVKKAKLLSKCPWKVQAFEMSTYTCFLKAIVAIVKKLRHTRVQTTSSHYSSLKWEHKLLALVEHI